MWQHKPLFDLGQSHDFQSNIMFGSRLLNGFTRTASINKCHFGLDPFRWGMFIFL
jgi:hypothetical protein